MRRAVAVAAGRAAAAAAAAATPPAAEPACSAASLASRRASGAAAGSRVWASQTLTPQLLPSAAPPASNLATTSIRPSPARLPLLARSTGSLRGYAADAAAADDASGRSPPSSRRVAAPAPPSQPPPPWPRPAVLRPPRTRGGGADGGAGAHAATAWRSRGGAGGPLAFLAKNGSARPKRPATGGGGGGGGAARPGRTYGATSALLDEDEDGGALYDLTSLASDGEGAPASWDHEAAEVGPVFPFSARAFYVGRRAEGCLARLRAAAAAEGLETVWDEPSSVMFRLGPVEGGAAAQAELQAAAAAAMGEGDESRDPSAPTLSVSDQYVAVFAPMGSVVFFNTPGGGGDAEAALWARLTAGGRLTCGNNSTHADDVRLLVAPGLEGPTRVAGDALVLRHPDTAVIKTVACVAAQTVALHFYEAQVDADLEQFRGANVSMAASGDFKAGTSKEALLKSVARNNVLMATIMGGGAGAAADTGVAGGGGKKRGGSGGSGGSGGGRAGALPSLPALPATTATPRGDAIGIMSRLDVAWHDPTCAAVYDHLRDDLEIDARLAALGAKLTFVQDNLKYFLEIMQNKKSDTLEWTIIVLIAAEICVSLYDLFFKGVAGG